MFTYLGSQDLAKMKISPTQFYPDNISNDNMTFFDWPKLVWNNSLSGNSTIDYYSLVIDKDDYYSAAKRFKWMLSKPDRIIALILAITGVVANIVSLIALSQVRSRISSYVRLIMSLSVADIMIGMSVILYTINKIVNPSYYPGIGPDIARLKSRCTFLCIKALNTTALTATLLNLMGMALDHYVAILKPLHYPILMNNRRKRCMIVVFWTIAVIFGFSDFFSGLNGYENWKSIYNYCEYVWLTSYQEEYPLFVIAFICLVTMVVLYVRIYFEIRRHQHSQVLLQAKSQEIRYSGQRPTTVQKNKKTLFTTLLILGCFIVCWLPNCLYQIALLIKVYIDPASVESKAGTYQLIGQSLLDLLLLNSICDPIIYSTRLKEVRLGFRIMCQKFCCCCCSACNFASNFGTGVSSYQLSWRNSQRSRLSLSSRSSALRTTSIETKPNVGLTVL